MRGNHCECALRDGAVFGIGASFSAAQTSRTNRRERLGEAGYRRSSGGQIQPRPSRRFRRLSTAASLRRSASTTWPAPTRASATRQKALDLLEAVAAGPGLPGPIANDPDLASLTGEPRFQKLVAAAKLAAEPCKDAQANPQYRQLDFWVGEWDVFSGQTESRREQCAADPERLRRLRELEGRTRRRRQELQQVQQRDESSGSSSGCRTAAPRITSKVRWLMAPCATRSRCPALPGRCLRDI